MATTPAPTHHLSQGIRPLGSPRSPQDQTDIPCAPDSPAALVRTSSTDTPSTPQASNNSLWVSHKSFKKRPNTNITGAISTVTASTSDVSQASPTTASSLSLPGLTATTIPRDLSTAVTASRSPSTVQRASASLSTRGGRGGRGGSLASFVSRRSVTLDGSLPTPRPSRQFIRRYDLRVNVPPSESTAALEVLVSALDAVRHQLLSEDASLVVYPWADSDAASHPALIGSVAFPTAVGTLRRYFSRINPRPMGGQIYVQVRLGHTRPTSELLENLGWWFKSEGHGLYERALQAENTVTVGWLLYSTRSMDLPSLTEAIAASDPALEVGLRWRLISLGRQGAIPVEHQVRAIHVEVDKTKLAVIKSRLYRIYGSNSNGPFPNGIKLRLVPEITPQMGPTSRAKVDRLRNRQHNFVQFSLTAQTWEIATLDFVDSHLGTSLRQLLMSIPSFQFPNRFVFHSVDPQWQRNGHIITFLPDVEAEARTIIAGMIPFLVFHYQDLADRIYSMFTPDAVKRVTEETMARWDPTTNSVVTFEDGILDSLDRKSVV